MSKRSKHDAPELAEFVALLTDHQLMLRGYIRSLIPNASDVRDVLQNTNLVLWEKRGDFKRGSNFKAWAFTVARYRSFEHRKKMKRDHRLVFDDRLIELIEQTPHDWSDELLDQQHRALEQCLRGLKSRDRALIDSRYGKLETLVDFARRDGRSEGSLRVTLNRLRTVLRDCIDGKMKQGEVQV
ncbi:sigma-70 family RNA polymerase sigma factor [Verrucomicrobiaceae bacterium N1E253]|uniref:Sigma-70 family RNA polymerase sigma factor n=1 Tax=Oceaniferula marina TaxID=2748318 RepID=A0A851GGA1_9BACT|nr:sigma-70 family RNA polymerase sigma factor [Oceaniferula marina]NWK56543.1 sigma-70 family RNA polymerase sigma factor [Oceaniferula marina]